VQQKATFATVYRCVSRPTASFGYQPAVDFYDELANAGRDGLSVQQLAERMRAKGWHRPRGGELTNAIMRVDLVSMCKNGFVKRVSG
jgi:hypothetical protein